MSTTLALQSMHVNTDRTQTDVPDVPGGSDGPGALGGPDVGYRPAACRRPVEPAGTPRALLAVASVVNG